MTLFLPLLLLVFGLVSLYASIRSYRQERGTLSWPQVEGVIENSRVYRKDRAWRVRVSYAFELNGVAYGGREESTWADGSTSSGRRRKRQRIAASYVPGESITVFYDPENPLNSTIAPGHGGDTVFMFLMGLGMTAAGVYLLWRL